MLNPFGKRRKEAAPANLVRAAMGADEPGARGPAEPPPGPAEAPAEAPERASAPPRCHDCGSPEALLPRGEARLCHACLSTRFRSRLAENYQAWLLGAQLRGIEQSARAGGALPPDLTLSLLTDLRRLRRCLHQIREEILLFDADPHAWGDPQRLGHLLTGIMAITEEVEPDLRAGPGGGG